MTFILSPSLLITFIITNMLKKILTSSFANYKCLKSQHTLGLDGLSMPAYDWIYQRLYLLIYVGYPSDFHCGLERVDQHWHLRLKQVEQVRLFYEKKWDFRSHLPRAGEDVPTIVFNSLRLGDSDIAATSFPQLTL